MSTDLESMGCGFSGSRDWPAPEPMEPGPFRFVEPVTFLDSELVAGFLTGNVEDSFQARVRKAGVDESASDHDAEPRVVT